MNDRELLELAAKAAGYVLDSDCERIDIRQSSGAPMPWNPLENDGDALRLAVKLNISIFPMSDIDSVTASCDVGEFSESYDIRRDYSATRRAIVRAAAEIGKGMK